MDYIKYKNIYLNIKISFWILGKIHFFKVNLTILPKVKNTL